MQLWAIGLEALPFQQRLWFGHGPKLYVFIDAWSFGNALALPVLHDIDRNINGRKPFSDLGSDPSLLQVVHNGWFRGIAHDAEVPDLFAELSPVLGAERVHHILLLLCALLRMVLNGPERLGARDTSPLRTLFIMNVLHFFFDVAMAAIEATIGLLRLEQCHVRNDDGVE